VSEEVLNGMQRCLLQAGGGDRVAQAVHAQVLGAGDAGGLADAPHEAEHGGLVEAAPGPGDEHRPAQLLHGRPGCGGALFQVGAQRAPEQDGRR
jgi:hypothetical protein